MQEAYDFTKRDLLCRYFSENKMIFKKYIVMFFKKIHKTTIVWEPPFFKLQVCRFFPLKGHFVSLNNFWSRIVWWRRCFNTMHYFEQASGLQLYMKETLTLVFSCQFCEILKIWKYKNLLRTLLLYNRFLVHNLARVQNLAWFKTFTMVKNFTLVEMCMLIL